MSNVLFLGNGINRAVKMKNGNWSWANLLDQISHRFDVQVNLHNEYKPFPLIFEEILFRKPGNIRENLKELKNWVSTYFEQIPISHLHAIIPTLQIEHIITTNYDYSLENALIPDFYHNSSIKTSTSEFNHSIFRHYQITTPTKQIAIWHAHGEICDKKQYGENSSFTKASSILIGYEHYSEYLSKIQDFLRGRLQGIPKIQDKLLKNPGRIDSWVDLFFTKNIIIAGFGLDFSETHLWWLLNYRALLRRESPELIKNRIIFCNSKFPDVHAEDVVQFLSQNTKRLKNQAKSEILESLSVEIDNIPCKTYEEYFISLFDKHFC